MKIPQIIIAAGLVAALTACGSSGDNTEVTAVTPQSGSPGADQENTSDNMPDNSPDSSIDPNNSSSNDTLDLVGLIKIEPNSTDADFSRAIFGRLETELTVSALENFYYPDTDACVFTRFDSVPENSGPEFIVIDQRPTKLSAGETIIISSNAGTHATLEREFNQSGPEYKTTVRLTGSAPDGLSVDIPGDDFPAFSNIQIGDVPALLVTTPSDAQRINAETQIEWIPNNLPESVFELYTSGFTGNGDEVVEIACSLVDDGSFSFPEPIRAALGDNYSENWNAFLRVVYRTARTDNAIVFTANSVASQ